MTYETIVQFAGIGSLLLFVLLFAIVLIYVLLPGKQDEFRRAARLPLRKDDEIDDGRGVA